MPKFRTKIQNRKMFGLAAKCGLGHDELKSCAFMVSGGRTDHTSKLYTTEADEIIRQLEAKLGVKEPSRRTVQHRRQEANVPQLPTAPHTKLMNDLARKRGIGEAGLASLCRKTLRAGDVSLTDKQCLPRTTAETSEIIEALKSMNKRDRNRAPKKEAA